MLFVLLCCLVASKGALSAEHHIKSANELIAFSKDVNSGMTFEGTTVFLDADIDFSGGFSEQFEPIGNNSNYFQGTFDGQGHTVNNLAISSSLQYVGLFGYSTGTTIKNVVLDSSCTMTSLFGIKLWTLNVGSIVGECDSTKRPCVIEGCVNMGMTSFSGSVSNLNAGGIIGSLSTSDSSKSMIKNCANYGRLIFLNTESSPSVYLGGVVGECLGGFFGMSRVENCLNYGSFI